MRGRGLDPAWYAIKAKGYVNKPPSPPDLKGTTVAMPRVPGWWVCEGWEVTVFLGQVFSAG